MKIKAGNFIKSLLRIIVALAVVLGVPAVIYFVWQPGSFEKMPEFRNNAIWLGHGWLGDDSWFVRNKRRKDDFRSAEKISALFKKLADNKIFTVYPHLCPAQFNGKIAPYDDVQTELFLDIAEKYGIKVIPWVGGVLGESVRISDNKWQNNFVTSVNDLLHKHPRLAGIQVNIEPMPTGNSDFLNLLKKLRPVTVGKILSVAAYPPPTLWHRFPDVHWELDYMELVVEECDQLAVMMYDTAIPLEKFYVKLMTDWTKQLTGKINAENCELLLGIPAYEDAGVGYHHPGVENISSALRGISDAGGKDKIKGIAIYCEWEMNDDKWRIWRNFIK